MSPQLSTVCRHWRMPSQTTCCFGRPGTISLCCGLLTAHTLGTPCLGQPSMPHLRSESSAVLTLRCGLRPSSSHSSSARVAPECDLTAYSTPNQSARFALPPICASYCMPNNNCAHIRPCCSLSTRIHFLRCVQVVVLLNGKPITDYTFNSGVLKTT